MKDKQNKNIKERKFVLPFFHSQDSQSTLKVNVYITEISHR